MEILFSGKMGEIRFGAGDVCVEFFRAVWELVWSFSAPAGRYLAGIVPPNQF